MDEVKIDFISDVWALETMLIWVREQVNKSGANETNGKKIELAMEEALLNIIHHAYKETDKEKISVTVRTYPDHIQFELKDKGIRFNPLRKKIGSQSHLSLEKIREGGVGIKLICLMMDDVSYQRKNGHNILTLTKKL